MVADQPSYLDRLRQSGGGNSPKSDSPFLLAHSTEGGRPKKSPDLLAAGYTRNSITWTQTGHPSGTLCAVEVHAARRYAGRANWRAWEKTEGL
ncbi:hypothetical protein GDO81_024374 [Engystomops pustulosus]|uniref:Uncharacterized protein n=1 Tax=Engystomops pustulosus TaxID=76066 RepID=A0AAV6YU56_ENGPU|nr:hypothetical protein GDO81_024374 [Engystomops pustulosus]